MKHFRAPVALIVLSVVFFAASPSSAAFDPVHFPGDDALAPAAGDQLDPVVERGGDRYLAVWMDYRTNLEETGENIEGGADLYAARLDGNGALIDSIPIPIATGGHDQYGPSVSWNGTAWLVAWNYRVYDFSVPEYDFEVRGVRVSAAGEVLDSEPVHLHAFDSSGDHVFGLASDGTNWALFVTQTYIQGLGTKVRLIGKRISGAGQPFGGATSIFSPSCCYFFNGDVTFANGEYFAVLEGFNTSGYQGVVGLRISSTLGNLTGSSPMNIAFPPGDYPKYYKNPTITTNGSDYLMAWDYRDGQSRICAGRMTSAFQALDGGGLDVSGSLPGVYEGSPLAAWDGAQWVVGWGESNALHLARISTGGSILDPGGDPFADFRAGDLAGDAPGGVIAVWADEEAGGFQPFDIHGARVASDFSVGAEEALSLGTPAQVEPDIASHGGGFLAVNTSRVSGGSKIHARVLDGGGFATTAEPIVLATGTSLSHPAVTYDGSVHLVVWSDGDQGKIFARRLLPDGTVLDGAPIEIMSGSDADVASLGGTFLVVGIVSGTPRAVRVLGSNGTVLDGTPISLGATYADGPTVAALGGRWLVAWNRRASSSDSLSDVRAAFVETNGTSPGEFAVASDPSEYEGDVTISSGPGQALIAWSDGRNGDDGRDVYGRQILTDGTLGPAGGVRITPVSGDQFAPSAAWDPDALEHVLTSQDLRNGTHVLDRRSDLYGSRFTLAGEVPDPDGFPVADGSAPEIDPSLIEASGEIVLVASWFGGGGGYSSYRVGFVALSGVATSVADNGSAPAAARLHGPSPNPFNPATTLRFDLPEAGPVRLAIYDLAGRRVATLVDGHRDAGRFDAVWNGKGDNSGDAASGVYFARFESGRSAETRKMLLLR